MIFCKSGTSLQLKSGKLLVTGGSNRGVTAQPKSLVAIGELQCDFVSTKNDQSNKKTLFQPLQKINPLSNYRIQI